MCPNRKTCPDVKESHDAVGVAEIEFSVARWEADRLREALEVAGKLAMDPKFKTAEDRLMAIQQFVTKVTWEIKEERQRMEEARKRAAAEPQMQCCER